VSKRENDPIEPAVRSNNCIDIRCINVNHNRSEQVLKEFEIHFIIQGLFTRKLKS
jgi:hypothetical protein